MKQLYGKEEAKRLSGEMFSYSLALSDSTQILGSYCYAADFSKLITEGRPWGVVHSAPAKRVTSYMQQCTETVHEMSNHIAGAIAIATLFFDIAHLIMYKDGINDSLENVNLDDVMNDEVTRKTLTNLFQTLIHSVNHTSRNGAESPFTNVSIFDRGKIAGVIGILPHLFEDTIKYDDMPKEDEEAADLKIAEVSDMIVELQKIYMDIFEKGDQMHDNRPMTFPVTTLNITKEQKEDGTWVIPEQDFLKDMSERELYRYNINASKGARVAMCCRFQNDYDLMKEQAKQVNSFGGEGIAIGSHRVNTLNLHRVALEATSLEDFYSRLTILTEDSVKILKAHKELLYMLSEKGLQKFVSNGWIKLDNLFSTVGIIGSYEMKETLEAKFDVDYDVVEKALGHIDGLVAEYSKQYGVFGNIEEIPGESLAVKLAKADTILFGKEKQVYKMYSNQFIPLWHDATIYERMEADGKYQAKLTGGGIVHFQIGSILTPTQNMNLVNDAVQVGCEHFAANPITNECANGHNTIGDHTVEACPVCGADIESRRTRVVGFQTKVNDWNEVRRLWEAPKRTTYFGK
jgi:ribonucleoside-triphosphate reductase (formate)